MLRRLLVVCSLGVAGALEAAADGTTKEWAPPKYTEDDVYILTPENFTQVLAHHTRVLVEFYAPWCGHCQAIAPEFAAAAATLASKGVDAKLAKVDAVAHEELAESHSVEGFPSFIWFDSTYKDEDGDTVPREYRGGRERADIAAWVSRHVGLPSDDLTTAAAASAWIAPFAVADDEGDDSKHTGRRRGSISARNEEPISAGIAVLTYLPSAELLPSYEAAVRAHVDAATFAHTTDAAVYAAAVAAAARSVPEAAAAAAAAGGAQPAALMLKPFDGRAAAMPPPAGGDGEALAAALGDFVRSHRLPLIVPFTERYEAALLEGGSEVAMQLVVFGTRAALDARDGALRAVAKAFRGQACVVFADVESDASDGLRELFDLERSGFAAGVDGVAFFGFSVEDEAKFVPNDELRGPGSAMADGAGLTDTALEAALGRFLGDLVAGSATPYRLSEAVPEQAHDGPVRVVVADTFEEVVLAKGVDVLLEIYAPWCGHCKALAPEYEQLAHSLKGWSASLTIAKMDGTKNEVPGIEIEGFPTVLLYTASNQKIELDTEQFEEDGVGRLTATELEAWLRKHAELPIGGAGGEGGRVAATASSKKEEL
jgi:protein disulfide-isomerase A1